MTKRKSAMTKNEIFNFLNSNPIFFLATQDGDQPRVRAMKLINASDEGLLFYTSKPKDLYKQLLEHKTVELCFLNVEEGIQVRVNGKVEMPEEIEIKKKISDLQPFLAPLIEKHGYEVIAPYYLREARAFVWDMKANFQPKFYVTL